MFNDVTFVAFNLESKNIYTIETSHCNESGLFPPRKPVTGPLLPTFLLPLPTHSPAYFHLVFPWNILLFSMSHKFARYQYLLSHQIRSKLREGKRSFSYYCPSRITTPKECLPPGWCSINLLNNAGECWTLWVRWVGAGWGWSQNPSYRSARAQSSWPEFQKLSFSPSVPTFPAQPAARGESYVNVFQRVQVWGFLFPLPALLTCQKVISTCFSRPVLCQL